MSKSCGHASSKHEAVSCSVNVDGDVVLLPPRLQSSPGCRFGEDRRMLLLLWEEDASSLPVPRPVGRLPGLSASAVFTRCSADKTDNEPWRVASVIHKADSFFFSL